MKQLTHYFRSLESRLTDEEKSLIKDGFYFLLQITAIFAIGSALLLFFILQPYK